MEDAIRQLKALQLTRIFMCHLLNLADGVKQTLKTFETNKFCVHSLAQSTFSSPKADRTIETLHQFKNI